MTLKEKANKLKYAIPTLYLCMRDKRTPPLAKILGAVTLAYALSPIDLIPDFIPFLGYLDDIIILPFLIFVTLKTIPGYIYNEHLNKAESQSNALSKKWYLALPIIFVWLIIIGLLAKIIWKCFN